MLVKASSINYNNNNNKINLVAFRADSSQYNYLKRKLDAANNTQEQEQHRQQQQQQHLELTINKGSLEKDNDFEKSIRRESASKKPYTGQINTPPSSSSSSSSSSASSSSSSASSLPPATSLIKPQEFLNNSNNSNSNSNISGGINNTFTINSNNSVLSSSSTNNSLHFNLLNNVFISDLFSYDNDDNLIDPLPTNTIMPPPPAPPAGAASLPALATATATAAATFAAPSNVCLPAQYIDGEDNEADWEATDLLELDHRYNSSFQALNEEQESAANAAIAAAAAAEATTIKILTETTAAAATMEALEATIPTIDHINDIISYQQQQQQPSNQSPFIIAPEPTTTKTRNDHASLKYRQHQHQHQRHQQHQLHEQHRHHQQFITTSSSSSSSPTPPPPEPSHDNDSDFEDKNLSWLLNFKFDDLPHLSPDVGLANCPPTIATTTKTTPPALALASTANAQQQRALKRGSNSPATSTHSSERSRSKSPKLFAAAGAGATKAASKKFEELVMEVTAECDGNDTLVTENIIEDYATKAQKKPPFTYTELIEYALEDKGELTVSGIYQWISDRFPFYKTNDDRWKNSVRHNLSINPHFRKGAKATQGAGHLWTISSGDSAENVLAWEHKKQRLELFFKMESMNRERIQEHQLRLQKQQEDQLQQQQQQLMNTPQTQQPQHCSTITPLLQQQPQPQQQRQQQQCLTGESLYDEAAVAAAAITEEMLQQSPTSSASPHTSISLTSSCSGTSCRELVGHHGHFHELHGGLHDLLSDEELRKTAGQILNGIHREVEVQSVNSIISTYHDVILESDYLNPIHKDVVVSESGLRNVCHNHHAQYYITDPLDPIELGIQMSHQVEEEPLFSDDFNLNYFSYNAATSNDITA